MTKKGKFFALVWILISIWSVHIGRAQEVPIDGIVMLINFFLILKYRNEIAKVFLKIKLPFVLVFLISALPFMLYEENIHCLPSGCRLIPFTAPVLILALLLLWFFLKKFRVKSFWKPLIIFCSIGVMWEIGVGAASAEFRALPLLWFLIIFLWTWISYAIFTIVPITLFQLHIKKLD